MSCNHLLFPANATLLTILFFRSGFPETLSQSSGDGLPERLPDHALNNVSSRELDSIS